MSWNTGKRVLSSSFLLAVLFTHGQGIFLKKLNLSLLGLKQESTECSPLNITCPCGVSKFSVTFEVPQCGYVHRFKSRCRPCEKMTTDNICPIFQYCSECSSDGSAGCLKCPTNRYGDWCEKVCTCQNGGQCARDGRCICAKGYEGVNCETRTGCRPPRGVRPPLIADLRPPDVPTTIVYSCGPEYHLRGASISTCLPDGQWSSPPPQCLIKCDLLGSPANGHLKYNGSELVEGVAAEISCNENYRLSGSSILMCLPNGKWSDDLPRCVEMALCTDPGEVSYATKIVESDTPMNGPYFLQEAKIKYVCDAGFEQFGEEEILCLFDGTWSREPPACVKASTVLLDCRTKGSEVVSNVGVPVRVFCPPECANAEATVWGTSIYRMNSGVCAAAVHAGKITNSGGLVAVINNGGYTNFAGSFINDVKSRNYEGRDESFRFDKLPSIAQERGNTGQCPEGLLGIGNSCVHISTSPLSEPEAEAVCTNLGLRLGYPANKAEQDALVAILTSKGINELWIGQYVDSQAKRAIGPSSNDTMNGYTTENNCRAIQSDNLEFVEVSRECSRYLRFVCLHNPSSRLLASCPDPGPLENGIAKDVGKMNGVFYVGSSIEYSCESLHYLKGEAKISCQANGTWSDAKPTCIRVDSCEEPPAPIGGYVNYLPPLDTPMAQRTALRHPGRQGFRMGRLPVGLEAKPPPQILLPTSTTTPGPEANITLPPGMHKVGTRAMYDCESRYYRLVGSRARRCEGNNQWSGRPPTCMPICGRSDSPRTPFIVNGNASDIGQWPWQVGLARYIQDYNQWFLLCGGSLLTERWVITAAHCVTYAGTTLPIDPDKFRVYLGKYYRDDGKDDEFVQVKSIHEMHIHPDYDPGIFDADIALLQLDTPVQLNSRVQPVCLPTEQTSRENIKPGKQGVVTGWGMNENETYSDTLQQAVLPVVSDEECERGYEESELPLSVTENMFCAGFKRGKMDACSGDSGGPMVFLDESSKERTWILEGIVSWGSPKGCGNPNQYGGFTEVGKFLDWIHLYF